MTPAQIEAVKNSWSKVTPIADQASVLFYERLFALDPSLRTLFKPDMTEQRKLLMTMLGITPRLTLPLLVSRIRADHEHPPVAADDLALLAHRLDRGSYFHAGSLSS